MATDSNTVTRPVRFVSHADNLVLNRVHPVPVPNAAGGTTLKPGVSYQFVNHEFVVDPNRIPAEQNVIADGPVDETGHPTQQDLLTWLRNHPQNGVGRFGFEEIDPLTTAPEPTPELLLAINQATADRDAEELIRIGNEEADGHRRPLVLGLVASALTALQDPEGE